MTIQGGNSYFHIQRGDRTRVAHTQFSPPFELLPLAAAPLEKQLRVFVNDDEYAYYDDTLITRPSPSWSYVPGYTAVGGIACWGVRFAFDPIGTADCRISSLAIWNGSDEVMTELEPDWSIADELSGEGGDLLDSDGFDEEVLDGHYNTNQEFAGSGTQKVTFRFPQKSIVSKFGFSSWYIGGSTEMVQNMEVQVNIGMPNAPNWYSIGSNLTQALGNSADDHTAGEAITSDDYPACTDPLVEETQLLTLSVLASDIGGSMPPVITLSTALTNESDGVTLIRETRQDRPWVHPVATSPAIPEHFMVYFDQIRFIAQELCDLKTIAGFFSVGMAEYNPNDRTSPTTLAHFHLDHAEGAGPYSYSSIELLETLPGADLDDRHQIIVQMGNKTDGTSTFWTTLTYSADPATELYYSVQAGDNTITLGDVTSNDLRIVRSTLSTRWWYDPRGMQPGWNSLAVNTMQKQARMLLEEACFIPQWYEDCPLSNSIFPRGWNWFRFVGTRNQWTIPGGAWGGDGSVVIYKNDLLLVEGTDYRLESPRLVWLIDEPTSSDTVDIGVSQGWGKSHMGGGDEANDEDIPSNPGQSIPLPPIEWPSWGVPTSLGFSLTIGSVSKATLQAGEWEGEEAVSFSQGNAPHAEFVDHVLRVELTVTVSNTVSDGIGGYYPIGAKEVWYITCKCTGTVYRVALAWKEDPADPWSSDMASGAFGCLIPGGASGGLGIWATLDPPVSSASDPSMRLYDRLMDSTVEIGGVPLTSQVPFFAQWTRLTNMSAEAFAAGIGSASGFSDAQWQEYLNPDEAFTDFDIPPS